MCFSLNLLQHLTLLVSEVTTFRGEGGGGGVFFSYPNGAGEGPLQRI